MKNSYDIELLREYEQKGKITGREHPDLPLVVWNYTAETQYGRLWDETTLSTRGLVTDLQGNTVAMCIPKFFNLAETNYTIEDFDVAYEKLDGSLIHVFNYDGQWVCSSRGSFESDQAKWAQELVDKNINWFQNKYMAGVTFVCELIVPENRIVVDYGDEESLRLLTSFAYVPEVGHKTLSPGWHEFSAVHWEWPWDKAKEIPIEALPTYLDKSGIEGVVLVGEHGRVKVKTDEYVEHHRIVTGLTTKNVLEYYVEHGNVDALLEVAPDEWYSRIGSLTWQFSDRVQFLETHIRGQYMNVMKSFEREEFSRKKYAIMVKGQVFESFLFKLLDNRSITEMVQKYVLRDYERYGLEL